MSKRPRHGQGNVPPVFTHHVVSSAGVPGEPHLQINLHFHINPQTGGVSFSSPAPNGQPPDQPLDWYAARETTNPIAPAADPDPGPRADDNDNVASEPSPTTSKAADSEVESELDPGPSYPPPSNPYDPPSRTPFYPTGIPPGDHTAYVEVETRDPPDFKHTEVRQPKHNYEKVRSGRGTRERSDQGQIFCDPISGAPLARLNPSGGWDIIRKPKKKSRKKTRTEEPPYERYIDTRRDAHDTHDPFWMI